MGKQKGVPILTMAKGHWSTKKNRFTGKGKVKDREAEVLRYLKFLNLDRKDDLMIFLDPNYKHGEHSSTIIVNPNLGDTAFIVTFAHEILHYKGLAHNCDALDLYFTSKSLKGDILSKTLAAMLATSVNSK